ncbi:MAG TPA: hypothetical protein VJ727_00495 [Rhodanobacteraceae bacterium]|nr:hypothetical protein [Rhodanobacteraceae bacterium]
MNRIFGKLILVAPLTLAVCAAYAQQTPPGATQGTQGSPQGTQGNMGNPQTTPNYSSSPTGSSNPPPNGNGVNGTNSNAASTNGGNSTNGAATPFDSLDTTHQGYLTRQNAATDSWLASHFSQCDADRDGRITRAECTACSRAHP